METGRSASLRTASASALLGGNWQRVDAENRRHSSFNEIISRNGDTRATILYDDNGNVTDNGSLIFRWDYGNRLRSVRRKADGAPIATYTYDAVGRRVRKLFTLSGQSQGTVDFYHSGAQEIEERNGADALVQQHVYGPYLDEPLVLDRNLNGDATAIGAGDQRLFYHQDRLHSVFALTDSRANIVEGYQFEPYGQTTLVKPGPNGVVDFGVDDDPDRAGSSMVGNPYLFGGRRLDPESKLWYYRSRYYDDGLGRFMSRDPAGYRDGMGLYNAYFIPNGLDPFGQVIVACSDIEDFLTENNVDGYETEVGLLKNKYKGQPTYDKGEGADDLRSEMLGTMIKSKHEFVIAGLPEVNVDNLKLHLRARWAVIHYAKNARFGFAPEGWELNPEYWQPINAQNQLNPNPDKTWREGFADLRNQPGKYKLGCHSASIVCLHAGAHAAVGEEKFAKLGHPFLTRQTKDEDDWVPGDAGYILNRAAGRIQPGQEGENLIYLGNDKYWGHGPGVPDMRIRTRQEWISEVIRWGSHIKIFGSGRAELETRRDYPKPGLVQ